MNLFAEQRQTHRLWKTYQRGQVGGRRDGLGVWDWRMHTEEYGMTGQRAPAGQHRDLYPVFCDNLCGKRIWNVCTFATESLHCVAEIITMIVNQPYFRKPCKNERKKNLYWGVPAVVQWVKSLTSATCISAEVLVQSAARHGGLKDPALPQLWLKFHRRPGNVHVPRVLSLKGKNLYRPFVRFCHKCRCSTGFCLLELCQPEMGRTLPLPTPGPCSYRKGFTAGVHTHWDSALAAAPLLAFWQELKIST